MTGAPTPLLTVWCAECKAEGQRDPGRLGVVERTAKGTVRWRVTSERLGRRNRPGYWRAWRWGVTLSHPAYSRLDVPEQLHAMCPTHGRGFVRTADVVAQRGKVGLKLFASG